MGPLLQQIIEVGLEAWQQRLSQQLQQLSTDLAAAEQRLRDRDAEVARLEEQLAELQRPVGMKAVQTGSQGLA